MSRVLFTQERWKNVKEINKKLMQQYIRNCRSEKKRPRTIEQYECDLKFFLCWNLMYHHNMNVLDFKKKHFNEFKFFMIEERMASNARVNRIMSVIRNMMSYAEDDDDDYEDYIRNPASKIKGLEKAPIKDIAFLSQLQIDLLREYLLNHKMYQHLCLLDILYDSGARINEVFQVSNTETANNGYLKVTCKGGRNEYILLHDRAKESLKLHLSIKQDGEAFWKSKYGQAKDTSTLRGWVKELYVILKTLDSKTQYFTPHSFRHSVIENMLNGSHYLCKKIGRAFTIEEVALIVHHKSTDMTKSYAKPKDNEIIFNMFGISIN
ncbi:tyrosine-type recombinase/integrase [Cellulosilyticum sp. ST5]|uniref:tyrosine-type recombinase/integrase n=1 Tax=Cellulosilyticum sp. ST5 TaxID=3055805 RepID=UPI0039778634